MADEKFEHWWDMDGKFYDGIDVEDAAHSAWTAAIASQRERRDLSRLWEFHERLEEFSIKLADQLAAILKEMEGLR